MIQVTVFEYEGNVNIDVGSSSYDISIEELESAVNYDWYTIFAEEMKRKNISPKQQEQIVSQIIEGLQSIPLQYRDLY